MIAFRELNTLPGSYKEIEELDPAKRKLEDFTIIEFPKSFNIQNLKYMDTWLPEYKFNPAILLPNDTLYDLDRFIQALQPLYSSGIKDIQLLIHKKKELPIIFKSGDYEIYLAPVVEEEEIEEEGVSEELPKEKKVEYLSIDQILELGQITSEKAKIPFNVRAFAKKLDINDIFFNDIFQNFKLSISTDEIQELEENELKRNGIILSADHNRGLIPATFKDHHRNKEMYSDYTRSIPFPENIDFAKIHFNQLSIKNLQKRYPNKSEFYIEMKDGTIYSTKDLIDLFRSIQVLNEKPLLYSYSEADYPLIIRVDNHQLLIAPAVKEAVLDNKRNAIIPFETFLQLGL